MATKHEAWLRWDYAKRMVLDWAGPKDHPTAKLAASAAEERQGPASLARLRSSYRTKLEILP